MSKLAINGGQPVRTKLFPAYRTIGKEEKKAASRVLDSGILSRYLGSWDKDFYGGPEVQAFEKEWARYFGVKHAIAVNSCTSGLQCAVGAAGIGPGDEVIVSPYTMSASATAPLWYGAIPIFADIEPDYFCLDPKSVRARLTPRTKALIVVDIFGQPYDATAINRLAKEHNLLVIEDCAQAPGATYRGKFAGTLADIGVYSLNYHKHIHTGEGGVVVTNNDVLADRIRLIRNHAEAVVGDKGVTNLINMVGFNFRLTEIQAAIGREQLKKLKPLLTARVDNCRYVADKLAQIPGITPAPVRSGATHAYYVQPFLFDEHRVGISRDLFIKAVKAELPSTKLRELEGAQISVGYVKPLYLLPIFQKKAGFGKQGYPFNLPSGKAAVYRKGMCPVVERMHEKELFLHDMMHAHIKKSDLSDIIGAFTKVYKHRAELKKTRTHLNNNG
ncbi:MAG: DegT/DnrJ/EryC1/StrS family aminotransferase [bacterium]|nr:DegT/DnrJ/EryC1/StrS family aminotransferase [bacterium]